MPEYMSQQDLGLGTQGAVILLCWAVWYFLRNYPELKKQPKKKYPTADPTEDIWF